MGILLQQTPMPVRLDQRLQDMGEFARSMTRMLTMATALHGQAAKPASIGNVYAA